MSRPFDEARYKGLLKGLEVAVIKRSQLNAELRYEAEFFRKRYLQEDSALSRWYKPTIGEFASVTDGPHGYHVVDEESPIVMLTAKNAKDWFSNREGADPIAEWVDTNSKRSSLEAGDVILSTRGTVGMCALVTKEVLPANIDQDVARISWANREQFLPEFVVAYLNSTYGQDHIARHASGMVQQGMSLQKVREVPLPLFSPEMQAAIAGAVQTALQQRRDAVRKQNEAEQILLRVLGLQNWQPPEPLSYTCSASQVFAAARFDAEYFNPAKQLVIDTLSVTPCRPLAERVSSVREMFVPGSFRSFTEVRNYDLTDALQPVLDETMLPVPISEIGSSKKLFKNGDVVISRLRSYLREIAIVRTNDDIPAMGSSEFIVLRPQMVEGSQLSPGLLWTYLRSQPVQTILKSCVDGSQHPRFSEVDLLSIPVPDVIDSIGREIDSLIGAAYYARIRATKMLEASKRAVEIAIEKSEKAALSFLTSIGSDAL